MKKNIDYFRLRKAKIKNYLYKKFFYKKEDHYFKYKKDL
jgi:hypothetical protein